MTGATDLDDDDQVTTDESEQSAAPVERWTPERRRARTRQALVAAARHVFARKGFEGASLDEIADTAGYTRGAIYKHFDGKEDLLFAVFAEINDEALGRFADLFAQDPALASDPTSFVGTWRDLFAEDHDLRTLELEYQLYELRHPEVREQAARHRRRNLEMVVAFMRERSAETGITFKVPVETLASIFLVTSDAFATASQFDPEASGLYTLFLDLFLPAVIEPESGKG